MCRNTPTRIACFGALALFFQVAHANDAKQEITQLIAAVENSGCEFQRNGKSYSPADAADHLQLKYSRGARYAKTAEDFIDNLASKSSLSGRPYLIACDGQAEQPSGDWLKERLQLLRSQ